jgi:hypothetical protein
MVKYISIIILFVSLSGPVYGQNDNSPLKFNGTLWMGFGPAVINSSKSIKVCLMEGNSIDNMYSVIISDPERLKELKAWILKKFGTRLNYSPVSPKYISGIMPDIIVLYSSKESLDQNVLLFIPLTNLTLECDEVTCKEQLRDTIKELKELINTK